MDMKRKPRPQSARRPVSGANSAPARPSVTPRGVVCLDSDPYRQPSVGSRLPLETENSSMISSCVTTPRPPLSARQKPVHTPRPPTSKNNKTSFVDKSNEDMYAFALEDDVLPYDIPGFRPHSAKRTVPPPMAGVLTPRTVPALEESETFLTSLDALYDFPRLAPTPITHTATPLSLHTTSKARLTEAIKEALERHRPLTGFSSTAPHDLDDLKGLRTAEDVISFFFVHKNPTLKFVHLNRNVQPTGGLFRPYNLHVVPRGAQDPKEYFMISATGVACIVEGQPAEVINLAEWMRESTLFRIISQIHFFRRYLCLKAFTQWRNNVSFAIFCQIRKKLCRHFFLSKATFAKPLMEVVSDAYALQTHEMLTYPLIRTDMTKENFIANQQQCCMEAVEQFRLTLDNIDSKLQHLCQEVTQRADVPNLASRLALDHYLMSTSRDKEHESEQVRNMASMVEVKEELWCRMRQLKSAMDENQLLPKYIRLVDSIVAQSLFRAALHTMRSLVDELQTEKEDKKMVYFIIYVKFGEGGLLFSPNCSEILSMLTELSEDVIRTISHVPRIATFKSYRDFFDNQLPRPFQLGTALHSDNRFQKYLKQAMESFEGDFRKAQLSTMNYAVNWKWHVYVFTEWPRTCIAWEENIIREGTLREWSASFSKQGFLRSKDFSDAFHAAASAFAMLREMHTIRRGSLNITSQTAVDCIHAKFKEIQVEVQRKLVTLLKLRLDRLSQSLMSRVRSLNERPTQLTKLVAFVQVCNRISDDSTALLDFASDVDLMFSIGEANGCETQEPGAKRDMIFGSLQSNSLSQCQRFEEALVNYREYVRSSRKDISKKIAAEIEAHMDIIHTDALALNQGIFVNYGSSSTEVLSCLKKIHEDITNSKERKELYTEWQKLFDIIPTEWTHLDILIATYDQRFEIWSAVQRLQDMKVTWGGKVLSELNMSDLASTIEDLWENANRLHRNNKNDISANYLELVKEEKEQLPTLLCLGNRNLKKDHWTQLCLTVHHSPPANADMSTFTLDRLRSWKFFDLKYREAISRIVALATGEADLQQQIETIQNRWLSSTPLGIRFEVKTHREESKDVFILHNVADIVQQLEDDLLTVQSCLSSRFVAAVRPQIQAWEDKLQLLSHVIHKWTSVQRCWIDLEFIFSSSSDIRQVLPNESVMFEVVDMKFKDLMTRTRMANNCISFITESDVLETLTHAQESFDSIHKSLEGYLESKRAAFPRFYFLSNQELMSILSDVRNPRAICRHLQKCFENIKTLDFNNEAGTEITAMISYEGEYVALKNAFVTCGGNVENLFNLVESMMRSSLSSHMGFTYTSYTAATRAQWILSVCEFEPCAPSSRFPAQCIQCIDLVIWAQEVENAIRAQTLEPYRQSYMEAIGNMVELVRGKRTTILQRKLLGTLLVVNVHSRDVVEKLVTEKVIDTSDFAWNMQLRYYWNHETKCCRVLQANATCRYSYEYLGNVPRLALTPLTDRSFLTLTSALHMKLGGILQGPTGTGKTESVRDLGKALARQFIIFSCSDGINCKTLSKMFTGLAQAGAWVCFDDFNRVELDVLSVVAQQMLEITTALSECRAKMEFDGRSISLHPDLGMFMTLNPDHVRRTALPDNLKALFRPVSMMMPDYALIAEMILYSEGFNGARVLARKMVHLYKLSSDQLSKQDHYDFGMHTIKSTLGMAGSLKSAEPQTDEELLLIRAIREANLPKFLPNDAMLFNALIKDLYPGRISLRITEKHNTELDSMMSTVLKTENLQPVPSFVVKIHQLFETMNVRRGVMMVGETLCGKTTCLRILQESLTKLKTASATSPHPMFEVTHQHVLNPKAISQEELYGAVNVTTKEWNDGVLPRIVRVVVDQANSGTTDRNWIVFDGPVDAVWMDTMNTALDDNKMLCVSNGERIKMTPTVSFCFEVQDLRGASPATISRCGIVFVEPATLQGGWQILVQSLLQTLSEKKMEGFIATRVEDLIEIFIPPCLEYLRMNCAEYVPSVDPQLVVNTVHLLECFLTKLRDNHDDETTTHKEDSKEEEGVVVVPSSYSKELPMTILPDMDLPKLLDMYFVLSLTWSIGGNVTKREGFAEFLKALLADSAPHIALPEAYSPYDVYVHKGSHTWQPWTRKVPDFIYRNTVPFSELFVHTPDTVTTMYLLEYLSVNKRHVLQNGVTGTGKSVGIDAFMAETLKTQDDDSVWYSFKISFSAHTTSRQVQEKIEAKLKKLPSRAGGLPRLGDPPGKQKSLFVVDDVSLLPSSDDSYNACPVIELLRQILTQWGFYERGTKDVSSPWGFKKVDKLMLLVACGGGRLDLTTRFTSLFHLLCQPGLADSAITTIFSCILQGFLHNFSPEIKSSCEALCSATTALYRRISAELLPTPLKCHYTFNLRDISKVIQGVMQIRPVTCKKMSSMVRVWLHETTRVFHDRLVNSADRTWWWTSQKAVLLTHFSNQAWPLDAERILFGDLFNKDKLYEELGWGKGLEDSLTDFTDMFRSQASQNQEYGFVLFDEAVMHLCRICRIIRQPRGNGLFIGVAGSGRRSLTTLAAFICSVSLFSTTIARNYSLSDFRDDLRKVLLQCGCEGKESVFSLSDSQLNHEQILDDIHSFLSTGEVHDLWKPEDIAHIVSNLSIQAHAKALGKAETVNNLMSIFSSRCRDLLHIVIFMSPVGDDSFRHRLRMFPSLVNCMTLDWFAKWSNSALKSVARKFLCGIVPERTLDGLCTLCVQMYVSIEEAGRNLRTELKQIVYTTLTRYIHMLKNFGKLLEVRKAEIEEELTKLTRALDQLESAATKLAEWDRDFVAVQPPEIETDAMEGLTKQIETEQNLAMEVTAFISRGEKQCVEILQEKKEIENDCQAKLDKALSLTQQATDLLNSLQKEDMNETRAYSSPPPKVALVLDAVLTVLERPLGWESAKKLLSDAKFIEILQKVDKDKIQAHTLKKLKAYIAHEDFTPAALVSTSKTCTTLVLWARAVDTYCDVVRNHINPQKARLTDADEKLEFVQKDMKMRQDLYRRIEQGIRTLQHQQREAILRKQQREEDKKRREQRLSCAKKLVEALSRDKGGWEQTVETLQEEKLYLIGTSLLTAGMIAYCGPFPSSYRASLLSLWLRRAQEGQILVPDSYTLLSTVDPISIRKWTLQGLASDAFFLENGVIFQRSPRWCLCVDPHGQANAWIKELFRQRSLQVIRPSEPNLVCMLESSARIGAPVLLENVGETLDPSLEPFLLRREPGSNHLEGIEGFYFIMTTKLRNPHYSPDLQSKVTLLNFSITPKGLEDQLLVDLVRFEKVNLASLVLRANRLSSGLADDYAQLKNIKKNILVLLRDTSGHFLDSNEVVEDLSQSKLLAEKITKAVLEAETATREIEQARETYRPIAARGSLLFFVILDLVRIEHMYQFSLPFYKRLFLQALAKAEHPTDPEECIQALTTAVTVSSYHTVCRGLYAKDKPIFSFLIATTILRHSGIITQPEWSFFLQGAADVTIEDTRLGPVWLPQSQWGIIQTLAQLFPTVFSNLDGLVLDDEDTWKAWYDAHDPLLEETMPDVLRDLSGWHRAMVIRYLRQDSAPAIINHVIQAYFGDVFTAPLGASLDEGFADSTSATPVIFLLSPGADPHRIFMQFAEVKGFGSKCHSMSLGQNQGAKAERLLREGFHKGHWIYLQNCHVSQSWMASLENLVEEMSSQDVHPDFRLFLTSQATKIFPSSVLQAGFKINLESPKGLKANMRYHFSELVDENMWNGTLPDGGPRQKIWHRLVMCLVMAHCVIQERRRFGPLGWMRPYDWNVSDLDAAMKMLRSYVAESEVIPSWHAVQYVLATAHYGGCVSDFLDLRCLRVLLKRFIGPKGEEESFGMIPTTEGLTGGLKSIEFLPAGGRETDAALLGLHDNAHLVCRAQEAKHMMDSLLALQPRARGAGEIDEEDDDILRIVCDYLEQVPPDIDKSAASSDTFRLAEDGTTISMGTVASQEVDRFNSLLGHIRTSLSSVYRALKGEVIMDDALRQMADALSLGRVPEIWTQRAYPSLKPLSSWFSDLTQRVTFFNDWVTVGPPLVIWLSAFFYPQSYLTAVLQAHARQRQISLDDLMLEPTVTRERGELEGSDLDLLESGAYVGGLFMQGARWDGARRCIQECRPRELYSTMPVVQLCPVSLSNPSVLQKPFGNDIHDTPLYKVSTRAGTSTNYIMSIGLPGGERSSDHWVLRGVALFLSMLDEE